MTRPLFRPTPVGEPEQYKTYQIRRPASHYRQATCEEVSCESYLNGWKTLADEGTPDGQRIAGIVRSLKGTYAFTEERDPTGGTNFTFQPGQRCFKAAEHRVALERPALYYVKRGDWRRSENVRQHRNADDWVDDFANHQDALKTRIDRG